MLLRQTNEHRRQDIAIQKRIQLAAQKANIHARRASRANEAGVPPRLKATKAGANPTIPRNTGRRTGQDSHLYAGLKQRSLHHQAEHGEPFIQGGNKPESQDMVQAVSPVEGSHWPSGEQKSKRKSRDRQAQTHIAAYCPELQDQDTPHNVSACNSTSNGLELTSGCAGLC